VGHANGRPVLVMLNGSNQEFSSRGVLNYITFDYYTFDLAPLANTDELVHYKPSDRYLHELFFPDLQQDWERRNRLDLLAEGHARLASPLYNIAAMALALCAILGGGFSRLGYGRRIAALGPIAAGRSGCGLPGAGGLRGRGLAEHPAVRRAAAGDLGRAGQHLPPEGQPPHRHRQPPRPAPSPPPLGARA
jgi:hypothetical protein